MTLPILYSFRRCPFAIRARFAIDVSGRRCALREVVLRDKPDAMLAASPKGTVPVLVKPDGEVLDESVDVMLWALSAADPEGWLAPPRGDCPQMLALIDRNDSEFKHHLDRYKYASRFPDEDAGEHRRAGADFLDELERRLVDTGYLFGSAPALADVALAPFVRQFAIADREWFVARDWPALQSWLAGFESSPRFERVMAKRPPWREGDPVTPFPAANAA